MRTGRPKTELELSEEGLVQLLSFARSHSLSAALCNRARLVWASSAGEPDNAIAERLKMPPQTVGKRHTLERMQPMLPMEFGNAEGVPMITNAKGRPRCPLR